jgi:hypothetical protein
VIGKVLRGRNADGLIRYLFGNGRSNEHVSPRVVAGWDEPAVLDPPVTARGLRDLRPLIGGVNLPLAGAEAPERCVWHCSLRAAPGDPLLSDAEWADVAAEVMDRTGLAGRGDDGGCRWVAVRHADDHVHLVVTLARQDGRRAAVHNDFYRVGEACSAVEERYGLAVTAGRDRSAARRSTRAETEKAARLGHGEAPRDRLRREVQTAAGGARDAGEFFDRLRGAGVLVRERQSPTQPGQVTGYAVAWPGFHNRDGQPVWYGGGRLAADLSLPKLEAHWRCPRTPGQGSAAPHGGVSVRVRLRHDVERAAVRAGSPAQFFAELRRAGVLVKERYSQLRPDELTGYAVALPSHTAPDGEPVWHAGGKLAGGLSLPRLQSRWGTAPAPEGRRTSRLTPEERQAVWHEAHRAASTAAGEIRHLAATDPSGAADSARAAADLLHIAARVAEPGGAGPLSQAARTYDRASRDLYGRTPPPGRTEAGFDLRLAALTLALVRRAAPSEGAAVAALVVALAGLVDAIGELRSTQHRLEQADSAKAAAIPLHAVAGPAAADTPTAVRTPGRTQTLRPQAEPPTRGRGL